MQLLCEVLGVPRSSAYYQPQPSEDRLLRDALIELAGQWPTYGYRRLTIMLKRSGLAVNTQRVRRLMHELGIAAEPPKRKPRTTDSEHPHALPEPGRGSGGHRAEAGVGRGHHLHPH